MNNDREENIGGASITPSARKSIHRHNNCPFMYSKSMGRYGLDKQNKVIVSKGPPCYEDDGIDELDNVMSKFARPTTPLPVNRRNFIRRNSLSTDKLESDDDSDTSDVLAKSLPATLPSYCSEKGYDCMSSDISHSHEYSNDLNTSQSSINRFNETEFLTNESYQERSQTEYQHNKSFKSSVLLVPFLVLMGAVAVVYYNELTVSGNSKVYDEYEFHNDLNNLGRRYKVSDDSILQVQTGISTIQKKQDTGAFIFAYNSKVKSFDPIHFNRFMDDIATTAARFLRNDSTSVRHIVVESINLDMQTHSELIQKYKKDVDRSGVMLVKELDQVPSVLAMAFHYYCDEYNPLVKKSAIFFTLNMATCTESPGHISMVGHVEKCLKNKWNGGVPQDNIGPLLSRVVASVVNVTSV